MEAGREGELYHEPMVSFVVPCYKLAHLLSECVNSILSQTYGDFEILVMDDCSPDETEKVARSFSDSRVRYVRNETNLGNLRNYNKGIELAKGKYIWLISADDRLRRPYVLDRYVSFLEVHPKVGYVFCPAIRLERGQEGEIIGYSYRGPEDQVYEGRRFLAEIIISGSTVVAPSGMARKECYEKVSFFPLDLPWGGDWYLWALFALHYDVAYFAEAMVNYRQHELSMTNALVSQQVRNCADSDVEVPRRILKKVEEAAATSLVRTCRTAIAMQYAKNLASRKYRSLASWHQYTMTLEEFKKSLRVVARDAQEAKFIRVGAYVAAADLCYWQDDFAQALNFYRLALGEDPSLVTVWTKYLLLRLGHVGIRFRASLLAFRQALRRN